MYQERRCLTKNRILPNGIRVVSRKFPEYNSVSVGIWVQTGSVNEEPEESGLSHFLEHMAFRGTERYDQYRITDLIDEIGGQINAFTTKEHTCFLAKVRTADLSIAIDVLAQLVTAPVLAEEHIELEKSVVLDEIAMYQDDPEDLVYEAAYQTAIRNYLPILGTANAITSFHREQLKAFYQRYYCGSNIVISIAGSFADADLDLIAERFQGVPHGVSRRERQPELLSASVHHSKELEQAQILILFPTMGRRGKYLYDLFALSHLLGSGHSSRLFKTLRGEHGLVYSISTDLELYTDQGFFEISFSTTEDKLAQTLDLIADEIRRLKEFGVSASEAGAARSHMTGSTILSLDGSQRYMEFLGHSAVTGMTLDVDEILASIDRIDEERINRLARELFAMQPTFASVGGFDTEQAERYRRNFMERISKGVSHEN